jgi:hypothetical protein
MDIGFRQDVYFVVSMVPIAAPLRFSSILTLSGHYLDFTQRVTLVRSYAIEHPPKLLK